MLLIIFFLNIKYKNLGIELFSQGVSLQVFSPLKCFTSEFEMDQCGSIVLETPRYKILHIN